MTKREFLDIVFALAPTEANAIMDAFDEYVDSNEPHWIPCSERLPEYGVDCLVTVKQKYPWQTDWEYFVDLGWRGDYIDGAWDTTNDWDEGQETHISAWMPLPEPFKGVTE